MKKITIKKVFEQFKQKEISIEHADGCPSFFEMTFIGFTKKFKNLNSYPLSLTFFKDDQLDYISLVKDQDSIGKKVIDFYLKNKRKFLKMYRDWLKKYKKMFNFYYLFQMKDLRNLSDNELIKLSDELHNFYENIITMPGFIDGFMFYSEKRFYELIKKIKEPISHKEISSLLLHTSPSFIFMEEEELFNLRKKLKRMGWNTSLKKFILKNKKAFELVVNHLTKYSWIGGSYLGGKKYSIDLLEKKLKTIKEPDKKIFLKNKKKKLKIIKKYNLHKYKELMAIIELSDLLIKWQDQRKEYTLTFATLKQKIIEEISLRKGIPFDLLKYSLNKELKRIIKGKFNIEKLKIRKNGVLFLYKNGKCLDILEGKEAREIFDELSKVNTKSIKELRGNIASVGKAKGFIKIIKSVKDLSKVNKGDIITSPMTRPEYVIAIKKASAIVTDDGGITCHAAIVSRELGIPCIIGTKIATKVLRDGDLVEVDADKGIIRIIKKH